MGKRVYVLEIYVRYLYNAGSEMGGGGGGEGVPRMQGIEIGLPKIL